MVKSEGPTGGAKVSAPLNGKISEKGSDSGRGNYVHLTAYKDGKIHRFYHMQDGSTDNVKTGDNISRGDEIGKIGNTGHSTGNHLHYEVRSKNGAVLNPINENPGLKNGSSSTKSVIRTPVEDKTSSLKFSTQLNVRQ
ncbi:MAG TPA: M23 family metallopeptidase [Cyclobacteriaceae bacterium]|nr:M23 family metallopeptidase [Cyclobacteriaceae bacterium]HRJ80241.1 M23 family metallopeptidase [Cyclobacteriaceae bacterium]